MNDNADGRKFSPGLSLFSCRMNHRVIKTMIFGGAEPKTDVIVFNNIRYAK